eukprot:gnl/TRDRNA2_/TRDRNA2_175438_c2_seq9.p1 gnl/TRDRNA2_/TRDRNA2_175438_c2~~gnl/TRDRNA2_/TRDRNA2_175438_c2_seq9.p1  ORF type:complete len:318 (-),score=41.56 gnl/TRDRNA2_/TRDRNA2_175438_c2_seq9:166-1119(-)
MPRSSLFARLLACSFILATHSIRIDINPSFSLSIAPLGKNHSITSNFSCPSDASNPRRFNFCTAQAAAQKVHAGGRQPSLVLYGDSQTFILNQCSKKKCMRGQTEVAQDFAASFGFLQPLILGIRGNRVEQLQQRLEEGELPDLIKPQYIMLEIGVNNLIGGASMRHSTDIVTIAAKIRALVQNIRERRPQSTMLVTSINPTRVRVPGRIQALYKQEDYVNANVSAFHEYFNSTDLGKVHFLDCGRRLLKKGGPRYAGDELADHMTLDREHPSREGYRRLFACWQETLFKLANAGDLNTNTNTKTNSKTKIEMRNNR